MSTENTSVESVTDDLDAFSAELFGRSSSEPETTNSEVEDTEVEDTDATNIDTQETDDDAVETGAEDTDDEPEADKEPEEKPKKNRFQERIDELTSKAKQAERDAEALRKRLAALENPTPKTPEPIVANDGPSAEDKNEDGTDKYPLGEFDPQYIRDLTKFTLQQEREALKAEEARQSQQQKIEAERSALQESWNEKLVPAQERYPDFQEKNEALYATFAGIDQNYGEYLAATIMGMDYGTDVLYHLASNPEEAKKIVDSGATKATIALGRLEAKFAIAEAEKTLARPKVTKAPTPPMTVKGSAAVIDVPDDTDDLDAFAKKLFKKR